MNATIDPVPIVRQVLPGGKAQPWIYQLRPASLSKPFYPIFLGMHPSSHAGWQKGPVRITPLLLALLLCLSACTPVTPAVLPNSDPVLALQNAQATASAANAYLERTAQANFAIAQAATLAAAQTRDARQARATEQAAFATATQAVVFDRATQTRSAADFAATQTGQAQQIENERATRTASAAQTATAYPPTQAALSATSTAIALAIVAAERRAFWAQFAAPLQALLPAVLLTALATLAVAGMVAGWPKLVDLLDALEMRVRTIISPDGEVITFLPRRSQVNVVQPKRSFGPALQLGPEGATLQGLAPDPQLQAETTARQQAAVLAAHLPRGQAENARRLLPAPSDPPAVRVLKPDEPLPAHLLPDPSTLQILDTQWRDEHAD